MFKLELSPLREVQILPDAEGIVRLTNHRMRNDFVDELPTPFLDWLRMFVLLKFITLDFVLQYSIGEPP
jgi:hypothetical protein